MSEPIPRRATHEPQRRDHFAEGRSDRLAGLPCRSANGRYLDGWYSVPNPRPIDRESLKPPRSSDRS